MCALRIAAQGERKDNSMKKTWLSVLGVTSIFQNSKGENKMDILLSCKFNIDTACVSYDMQMEKS